MSSEATLVEAIAGVGWHPPAAAACGLHHILQSSVARGPAANVRTIERTTARNTGLLSGSQEGKGDARSECPGTGLKPRKCREISTTYEEAPAGFRAVAPKSPQPRGVATLGSGAVTALVLESEVASDSEIELLEQAESGA